MQKLSKTALTLMNTAECLVEVHCNVCKASFELVPGHPENPVVLPKYRLIRLPLPRKTQWCSRVKPPKPYKQDRRARTRKACEGGCLLMNTVREA